MKLREWPCQRGDAMRRMGICALVVLCVLWTMPVLAADGGHEGEAWWDAVVAWVHNAVRWLTGAPSDSGSSADPNEFSALEDGNGSESTESEAGHGADPNGFSTLEWGSGSESTESDSGNGMDPNG